MDDAVKVNRLVFWVVENPITSCRSCESRALAISGVMCNAGGNALVNRVSHTSSVARLMAVVVVLYCVCVCMLGIDVAAVWVRR